MYSSNPRRVGIYNTYTWASIHMGSIYTNAYHFLEHLGELRIIILKEKRGLVP